MKTIAPASTKDIFISYSRKDKPFVSELNAFLEGEGKDVWIDLEDIPHGVDFIDEIKEGIESAENFIFLISPDSVASEICNEEVEHAAKFNKRIIPVLVREASTEDVPKRLAALNWIISGDRPINEVGGEILDVMHTDVPHVKLHTSILNQAIAWEKANKTRSLMMRGSTLKKAEAWVVGASRKTPRILALQSEYIAKSRLSQSKRLIFIISGVVVALIITVIFGVIAMNSKKATEHAQEQTEVAQQETENAQASERKAREQEEMARRSEEMSSNAQERAEIARLRCNEAIQAAQRQSAILQVQVDSLTALLQSQPNK